MKIFNKTPSPASDFEFSNGIITKYKGKGGDVVIPDDKGILYIGPYAFSLYESDEM